MAAHTCPSCGSTWNDSADLACRECGAHLRRDWRAWLRGSAVGAAGAVSQDEGGDALWARIALVATVVVTVAMAAMVLVMTIRGMHLPR